MATSLKRSVAALIRPVLLDSGYIEDHGTFRLSFAEGVCALVDLRVRTHARPLHLLWVSFGVFVPKARPWLPLDVQTEIIATPGIEDAQFRGKVLAPPEHSSRARFNAGDDVSWALVDGEDVALIGDPLRQRLQDAVIPTNARAAHGERNLSALSPPDVFADARPPFVHDGTQMGDPLYQNW